MAHLAMAERPIIRHLTLDKAPGKVIRMAALAEEGLPNKIGMLVAGVLAAVDMELTAAAVAAAGIPAAAAAAPIKVAAAAAATSIQFMHTVNPRRTVSREVAAHNTVR